MSQAPVIVAKVFRPYGRAMVAAIFRMLALAALLLMPAGMAAGPALAQAAAASADHCADHQMPADAPAQPQAHCTGCAALPALEAPPQIAGLLPEPPRMAAPVEIFSGIILEIATPPPKLA